MTLSGMAEILKRVYQEPLKKSLENQTILLERLNRDEPTPTGGAPFTVPVRSLYARIEISAYELGLGGNEPGDMEFKDLVENLSEKPKKKFAVAEEAWKLARKPTFYIRMSRGEVISTTDVQAWAQAFTSQSRAVEDTRVTPKWRVATSFIGIDFLPHPTEPPLLWETAVTDGATWNVVNRYRSEAAALEGHNRTVRDVVMQLRKQGVDVEDPTAAITRRIRFEE